MRVLVVEDDVALAGQLRLALEAAGFAVDVEHDGEAASFAGTAEAYSAAVLDLGLPRKDGLSVLRDWREAGGGWPVLVLTARNRWSDKLAGFNAGADDYLTKPFLMDEVVLRLRAMLRRTAGVAASVLRAGPLEYDVVQGRFVLQGQGLQLTAQEHRILAYFMHHPGRLLTRGDISEHVYARDLDPDSNTLDVLIGRIRRKLGGAPRLVTERGQGFRLEAGPGDAPRGPA
ncbi:response regulator with CheY-like receiver domain and winged-helix DNA-binding domain [Acidovorax sp. CF316]|uniref:response regulator transcription factor n=1 Tax=Acidovorax sp. CF316 TaxID=1144317 RepID=UPI00026BCFB9|nr:response regulator transcription factor [Acidovorax sp. CF316]EJE51770.1 response regulator with CheY-like receiver domain and winged-helix DNA-binding domain [Acidovorax sp. CF316]